MINVALFDKHKLTLEGLSGMIENVSDLCVVFATGDRKELVKKLKENKIHVIVMNLYSLSEKNINLIIQTTIASPNVNILISSVHDDQETIFKAIRAGVKGFLGASSGFDELKEAIYTLRYGHDYFSESLTHLVVNSYVSKMGPKKTSGDSQVGGLSERQVEILRMWGESFTNQQIADSLFISVRTVESHKNHIMQKLNLKSTVEIIKFAIKNDIIEL